MTRARRRLLDAARTPALLAGLLGAFLLPVATANLRGVTHLIDCRAPTREAFEVRWTASDRALLTGSSTVTVEDGEGICDDVDADVAVRPGSEGRVTVTVRVRNDRAAPVHATVIIDTGSQKIPVRLGPVPATSMSADQVIVRGGRRTTAIRTQLLVGP